MDSLNNRMAMIWIIYQNPTNYTYIFFINSFYCCSLSNILFQKANVSPVGTLAYILEEEALLIRVNRGWQYVLVSVCVCTHNVVIVELFSNDSLKILSHILLAFRSFRLPISHLEKLPS